MEKSSVKQKWFEARNAVIRSSFLAIVRVSYLGEGKGNYLFFDEIMEKIIKIKKRHISKRVLCEKINWLRGGNGKGTR